MKFLLLWFPVSLLMALQNPAGPVHFLTDSFDTSAFVNGERPAYRISLTAATTIRDTARSFDSHRTDAVRLVVQQHIPLKNNYDLDWILNYFQNTDYSRYGSTAFDYYSRLVNLADFTRGRINWNGPSLGFQLKKQATRRVLTFTSSYRLAHGLKDHYPETETILREGRAGAELRLFSPEKAQSLTLSTFFMSRQEAQDAESRAMDLRMRTMLGEYSWFNESPSLKIRARRNEWVMGFGINYEKKRFPFDVTDSNFSLGLQSSTGTVEVGTGTVLHFRAGEIPRMTSLDWTLSIPDGYEAMGLSMGIRGSYFTDNVNSGEMQLRSVLSRNSGFTAHAALSHRNSFSLEFRQSLNNFNYREYLNGFTCDQVLRSTSVNLKLNGNISRRVTVSSTVSAEQTDRDFTWPSPRLRNLSADLRICRTSMDGSAVTLHPVLSRSWQGNGKPEGFSLLLGLDFSR